MLRELLREVEAEERAEGGQESLQPPGPGDSHLDDLQGPELGQGLTLGRGEPVRLGSL